MGVFLRFMGSPDCKDLKNAMEEVNFRGTGFKKETFKRGVNQVPRNLTSSIAFFKSLQSGLPMNLKNTPMPRIFFLWITNPWHGGVFKVHGKSRLQGFEKRYGGS